MTDHWPYGLDALARALPFEHLVRRRAPDEAIARWRLESQSMSLVAAPVRIGLLLQTDGDVELAKQTVASWRLQTWPAVSLVLVGEAAEARREALAVEGMHVVSMPALAAPALRAHGIDWLTSASVGDLLHPSLATRIGLAAAGGAHALAWDWFEAAPDPSTVQVTTRRRSPLRDEVAELDADLRGHAFAARLDAWTVAEPFAVRMGLHRRAGAWHHWAEPLGIYRARPARGVAPEQATRLWGTDFDRSRAGTLDPRRGAGVVSVIVLYRDRPELTLRAIRSVCGQQWSGGLQLVLVDNQSNAQTRAEIQAALAALPAHVDARVVPHDEPFNHSRQCNRGARAAVGDVLLFLNNDAELLDAGALAAMSRWAAVPGVATVGLRAVGEDGRAVGGGMRARRLPGAEFNSPVEEAVDDSARMRRVVVGNTFACAAIARERFFALGGLDEVEFPNGYNDVDFCLRATGQGHVHVNLGDLQVLHRVGASRARTDEIAQKVALRVRHPWLSERSLQEHDFESVTLPPVRLAGLY